MVRSFLPPPSDCLCYILLLKYEMYHKLLE